MKHNRLDYLPLERQMHFPLKGTLREEDTKKTNIKLLFAILREPNSITENMHNLKGRGNLYESQKYDQRKKRINLC